MHWVYKVFIRNIEPGTDEKLLKPDLYASVLLKPGDNACKKTAGFGEDLCVIAKKAFMRSLKSQQ